MEGAAILLLLFCFLFFYKIYAAELNNISDSQFLTDGDTLVSESRNFELGFFQPEGSKKRYLGIWYKKVSVRTVVWVANREHTLTGETPLVLKIVDPGILVLFKNMSMIWSSNTTMTSRNATAKLHDNGNLVLTEQERVIWQSFDYPTDTLLPGMKLGKDFLRGIEWHLSSWKSSQDPAPSDITWGADIHGYPENKLKQGEVVKYRGGPWSNRRVSGYTVYNRTLSTTYTIVINEKEVSFAYSGDKDPMISRVALSSSGKLEASAWVEESKKWQLSLTLPNDICDTYNICSAYGSCTVNMVQQSCACLDEKTFVPKNQKGWEMADWSGGCVRRTPLDCKNGSEGFIKYSNVKLPDTERTWFNMSMTLEECKTKCLKNCSCTAYANPDTRFEAKGCLLWFGDLFDIKVLPEGGGGRDIFVRMASSELVAPSNFKRSRAKTKIILLLIVPGVLLIGFICTWMWYARSKRNHVRPMGGGKKIVQVHY